MSDTVSAVSINEDAEAQQLKAILESASHNIGVVINQIESLDDNHPMPEVVEQMKEAEQALKDELTVL